MWIQCENSTGWWFSYPMSLFTRQPRWWHHSQQEALRERKSVPRLVSDRETIYSGVNRSSQFLLYSHSEYSSSRCSLMLQKREKKTDPENGLINPVFKGFNASPPQFFQVVSYAIADISWKFHENILIYLSIILLTDTPPRQDGRPWNSVVRRETVYLFFSCVVPDISWKFDEDPFIRFSIMVLTVTDSRNRKKSILNSRG